TSAVGEEKGDAGFFLWDVDNARGIREWTVPKVGVSALTISPDGKRALAALFTITKVDKEEKKPNNKERPDVSLVSWHLDSGRELHSFSEGQKVVVLAVAIDAKGQRALAGDELGKFKLCDLERGVEIGKPVGHPKGKSVQAVAFSPSGLGLSAGKDQE